jgi:hypothetical protein
MSRQKAQYSEFFRTAKKKTRDPHIEEKEKSRKLVERKESKGSEKYEKYPKTIDVTFLYWSFGDSLDVDMTGGDQWVFIHIASLPGVNTGNPNLQSIFPSVIHTNLTCMECFSNMSEFLRQNPFRRELAAKSPYYAFHWWNAVHNEVNRRQSKPEIPQRTALDFWTKKHQEDQTRFLRSLAAMWHFCARYQLSPKTRVTRTKRRLKIEDENESDRIKFFNMLPLARFVYFIQNENFLTETSEVKKFLASCRKQTLLDTKNYYPDDEDPSHKFPSPLGFQRSLFRVEEEQGWGHRVLPWKIRQRRYMYAGSSSNVYDL